MSRLERHNGAELDRAQKAAPAAELVRLRSDEHGR